METNNQKKWYQKKRYWVGGILTFVMITVLNGGSSSQDNVQNFNSTPTQQFNTLRSVQPKVVPKSTIQDEPLKQSCHPSYSGCLNPNASDYDCARGSGNGPYYTGRVQVIGYDEYGLDRDGDGWGCEN